MSAVPIPDPDLEKNKTIQLLEGELPSMEVESLSGGNIDIITFLARHSEQVFPQDVERRFGITRSTSSRVLALMERKNGRADAEREDPRHDHHDRGSHT